MSHNIVSHAKTAKKVLVLFHSELLEQHVTKEFNLASTILSVSYMIIKQNLCV